MDVNCVEQHGRDWVFVIHCFSLDDLQTLERLLQGIGVVRDRKAERRSGILANHRERRVLLTRYFKHASETRLSLFYYIEHRTLSATWTSSVLNGMEFVSLLLSNVSPAATPR